MDAVVVYSFVGFKTATTKGTGTFTVNMERETIRITQPLTLDTSEAQEDAGDEYLVKGKVIEAMTHGIPVVTTTVGAEGLPDSEDVLYVASEADEFAAQLTSVLKGERLQKLDEYGQWLDRNFSKRRAEMLLREVFGPATA